MSDTDPDTNGGLPPKISLKPKSIVSAPKDDAKTDASPGQPAPPAAEMPRKPTPLPLRQAVAPSAPRPATPEMPTPEAPRKPVPLRQAVAPSVPKPITPLHARTEEKTDAPVPEASDAEPSETAAEKIAISPRDTSTSSVTPPSPVKPAEAAQPSATANPETSKPLTIKASEVVQPAAASPEKLEPSKAPTLKLPEAAQPVAAVSPAKPEPLTMAAASGTADEAAADTTDASVAPKRPVLRPVGSGTVKRPVPLGIRKDGPDPAAAPGTKRSTSRITLPSAAESATTPGEIRTIKITPRSNTTKVEEKPDSATGAAIAPDVVADPKRQTSRISLESVLGGQSANAPSTIKIKRAQIGSSGSGGIKTAPQGSEAKADAPTIIAGGAPRKPQQVSDDKPESQKKTLKVKRPEAGTANRAEVSADQQMFSPPVATMNRSEKDPHWSFSIVAIAATLVAGVLIYVLAAQVTDPDLTVQPPPEPKMPWPARLNH